ncbi:MAG TPA: ShlB/FhaC/HecB family hemolysin secretion/activation protein [Burkholderiales bacterium]|nr:ShlB/FhaC/HecB family hemolysin secretion/activation protein [Burkholderiales bacterium]
MSLHRLVAFVVFSVASALVLAQQKPDAGQILEQTREPLRLPPPSPDLRPKPPEPKPALGAQPQLKVKVSRFTFSGNTLIPEDELQEAVKEFVGKELNFEGLNDAATEARAYYRSRGYFLAQAYLPQQAIRGGSVEITIIEGRWDVIELNTKPATQISTRLLAGIINAHLQQSDIITETGLERPLLLINDLPDASVTTELRPGETVGAANLRVNVDPGAGSFNGFVDIDNYGNRFTGEYRLGANLNLSNPAGYGDRATLRAFTTDEKMWYARLAYDLPVGYYGTRVGVSYSKFDYALSKDFASLGANGEGEVKGLYAFHPIVRTRNTNLILNVAYEEKQLIDRIENPASLKQSNIQTTKVAAVGDFRDAILGGGLNAYSLAYTFGNLGLSPVAAESADLAATGRQTEGNFHKTNYDLRRQQRVSNDASILFSFSHQWASRNLASAEKMSLGGPNGVRAYPVGEATADSGMIATVEPRYIVPGTKIFDGDMAFLAFFDVGWAKVNQIPLSTDGENIRHISGVGLGTSLGKEGGFLVRASMAWKYTRQDPESDKARRVPRVWIQAIKWF